MANQVVTYIIKELNETRTGSITFRRNSKDQQVECVVSVERVTDGYAPAPDASLVIDRNILADGSTIFTNTQWDQFKNALKTLYDYARDELSGS